MKIKVLPPFKALASFFISVFLAATFFSCSDISSKDSGEVSFSLSEELVRAISSRAAADDNTNSLKFKIELAMTGDVEKSVSKIYTEAEWDSLTEKISEKGEEESFTFKDIPVGSKVKVIATISQIEDEQSLPFMKGESEEKLIEEGENTVTLKLKIIDYTLVANFYLQNENDYVLSEEYSTTFKTDIDDYEEKFDTYLSQFESEYKEKSYVLFGEKAYIPNAAKINGPLIDSDLYTITINYYFDLATLLNGEIAVENPVQKYTLAKNTAKSSKNFYKNYGTFVFSLLDENGNDVLADVDWENEKNENLYMRYVEFKKGNKDITSSINYDKNEVGISNMSPLNKDGSYQLTLIISPLAARYVNTSNETVDFPSFEPVTGTFEIEVKDAYAFDSTDTTSTPSAVLSSVSIIGNVTDDMWKDESSILYKILTNCKETSTTLTFEGNVETPSYSSLLEYYNSATFYKSEDASSPSDLYAGLSFIFNGIAKIGDNSFNGLELAGLKFTTFESTIGNNAFQGAKFETVDLTGVKTIGESAFNNCNNLKDVTIPDSVAIIRKGAFASAIGLESVTFAVTKGWIGASVFDPENPGAPVTEDLLDVTDADSNAVKLSNSDGEWVNMDLYREED